MRRRASRWLLRGRLGCRQSAQRLPIRPLRAIRCISRLMCGACCSSRVISQTHISKPQKAELGPTMCARDRVRMHDHPYMHACRAHTEAYIHLAYKAISIRFTEKQGREAIAGKPILSPNKTLRPLLDQLFPIRDLPRRLVIALPFSQGVQLLSPGLHRSQPGAFTEFSL